MASAKVIFCLALFLAVASCQNLQSGPNQGGPNQGGPNQGGPNQDEANQVSEEESEGCPPNNPFCPVWVPCNYTEVQGPTCQDCHTRVICTAVGGLVRPCLLPWRPHCVNGRCSAEPSPECADPPTPPAGTPSATEIGVTQDYTK